MPENENAMIVAQAWMAKADNDLRSAEYLLKKTHDLEELVALVPSRLRPSLDDREQDRLTEYATVTRYPGDYEPISVREARQAVGIARRVRREVRRILQKKPLFQ
jgi:HEPN domain-containing protein